jgi:hypothetical protein
MDFPRSVIDRILVDTGRRCCLCGTMHRIQVHHLQPVSQGGSNDYENAITLCPNCHDEVHRGYSPGSTMRSYTVRELKKHRERTIDTIRKATSWSPGSAEWERDKELILFFAQCLDRPAFHTPFLNEISFLDFDRAMEDTLLALNTGYWRTRDGVVIARAAGKCTVTHKNWRDKLDQIVHLIESVRKEFAHALGLDTKFFFLENRHNRHHFALEKLAQELWRHPNPLEKRMDSMRQEAIDIMNSLLDDIGHSPLEGVFRDYLGEKSGQLE